MEAFLRRGDGVLADGEERDGVAAALIARGLASDISGKIGRADDGVRHNGAGAVSDRSDKCCGGLLRIRGQHGENEKNESP